MWTEGSHLQYYIFCVNCNLDLLSSSQGISLIPHWCVDSFAWHYDKIISLLCILVFFIFWLKKVKKLTKNYIAFLQLYDSMTPKIWIQLLCFQRALQVQAWNIFWFYLSVWRVLNIFASWNRWTNLVRWTMLLGKTFKNLSNWTALVKNIFLGSLG